MLPVDCLTWLLPALAHLTSHPPPSNPAWQVATDTRLWLYGQVQMIRGALRELIAAAADRAEAEVDVLLPGFTHLQPAQVRRLRAVRVADPCLRAVCCGPRPGALLSSKVAEWRRGGCCAQTAAAVRHPTSGQTAHRHELCLQRDRRQPCPNRRRCGGATGC